MRPEPYDEQCDIFLDARVLSDPDGDRDHTGRHQGIIARMVAHTAWAGWLRDAHRKLKEVMRNWTGSPIIPVVVFCRSGRHRSVAASELLKGAVQQVEKWEFLPSLHISIDMEHAGCCCKNCRHPVKYAQAFRPPFHLQYLLLAFEIDVLHTQVRRAGSTTCAQSRARSLGARRCEEAAAVDVRYMQRQQPRAALNSLQPSMLSWTAPPPYCVAGDI